MSQASGESAITAARSGQATVPSRSSLRRSTLYHLHLVGQPSFYGILESYDKTALRLRRRSLPSWFSVASFGKWLNLASAYITGISVGILVRSPAYWPFLLCSVISIMSKYVLRVKGRHIWNPSNFGIAVLLFLAPENGRTEYSVGQ